MGGKALMIEYCCKPEGVREFIWLARCYAQRVLENEPGCVSFEIGVCDDAPNTVFLYEVYRDDAALQAHRRQPHTPGFLPSVTHLIDDRTRLLLTVTESPPAR